MCDSFESYMVARVQNLELEVNNLKAQIKKKDDRDIKLYLENCELTEKLDAIQTILNPRISNLHDYAFIELEYVSELTDPVEFAKICEIFGLEMKEEGQTAGTDTETLNE